MARVSDMFTPDDFAALSVVVLDAWQSAIALDWSVPAGTLEWSCWSTADHTIGSELSARLYRAVQRRAR
jgi:hypothetical protein